MAKRDYYEVLGIAKGASTDEIKKAYRKKAMEHHPDKGGDEEKFKEVNEAYQTLSDPQKKAQYDQFGHSAGGFPGGGGGAGFGGFQGGGFSDIGDIFETFFGGNAGFQQARRAQPRGPRRGADIEVRVSIDFADAVSGAKKRIDVTLMEACETCKGDGAAPGSKKVTCSTCSGTGEVREQRASLFGTVMTASVCGTCQGEGKIPEKKCTTCNGAGRMQRSKTMEVDIPAGIEDGNTLRLSGKGHAGEQGGPSGDIYVHVQVKPSRSFKREGANIHTTESIHVLQAILGDEITVETVHGKKTVTIPAGVSHGKRIRLQQMGMPKLGSSEKGDHYIHIEIDIPKKLSKTELALYKELVDEAKLKITPQKKKGIFG